MWNNMPPYSLDAHLCQYLTLMYAQSCEMCRYGYDQRVECLGETGMASAHNEVESTLIVASAGGFVHAPNKFSFPQRYKQTYTDEIVGFVRMVQTGA